MKNKHRKMRAIELFAHGTPFKPKIVQPKNRYKRHSRSQKKED